MARLFLLASILVLVWGCGSDGGTEYRPKPKPAPTPDPNPDPNPGGLSFAEIKPNIDRYCGGCHNGSNQRVFRDGDDFKRAGGRISNNTMPPNGNLPLQVKNDFLKFIEG